MTSSWSTADEDIVTEDQIENLYNELVGNNFNNEGNTASDDDASGVSDKLISKKTLLDKLSAWVQKNKK